MQEVAINHQCGFVDFSGNNNIQQTQSGFFDPIGIVLDVASADIRDSTISPCCCSARRQGYVSGTRPTAIFCCNCLLGATSYRLRKRQSDLKVSFGGFAGGGSAAVREGMEEQTGQGGGGVQFVPSRSPSPSPVPCSDGQIANEYTGICQERWENCTSWVFPGRCRACQAGFALLEAEGAVKYCSTCVAGCINCNLDYPYCEFCDNGFRLDLEGCCFNATDGSYAEYPGTKRPLVGDICT